MTIVNNNQIVIEQSTNDIIVGQQTIRDIRGLKIIKGELAERFKVAENKIVRFPLNPNNSYNFKRLISRPSEESWVEK